MKLVPEKTALLVIDVQWDYWKLRLPQVPPASLLFKLKTLIHFCRSHKVKVVYVKHNSHSSISTFFQEGTEGAEIMEEIKPLAEETVITKHTPGAFFNTNLHDLLREKGIENLILTGMRTEHCCDTTTREAHALGYRNYFISDCTATFDIVEKNCEVIPREEIQKMTQAVLNNGFATIMDLEALISLF